MRLAHQISMALDHACYPITSSLSVSASYRQAVAAATAQRQTMLNGMFVPARTHVQLDASCAVHAPFAHLLPCSCKQAADQTFGIDGVQAGELHPSSPDQGKSQF